LVICHKCTWGLTPEQHDNLEAIGARYEALMDQLMRSDLPPLDQHKQCCELNGRLAAWEQDLMARNLIQEGCKLPVMRMIRAPVSRDAPQWGFTKETWTAAPSPSSGSTGAEHSAAAASSGDAADDGSAAPAEGKKKPNKKSPAKTLQYFEKWTPEEWEAYWADKGTTPRDEWNDNVWYEVLYADDGKDSMTKYDEPAHGQLLDSYFSGAYRCDIEVQVSQEGRYHGKTHMYAVFWVNGREGLQFSKVSQGARNRKVVITATPKTASGPTAAASSGGWSAGAW
jgi:hypothetical protein